MLYLRLSTYEMGLERMVSFVYIVRESQQKVCILTMSVSLLEISLQDLLGTVLSFSSFLKLD